MIRNNNKTLKRIVTNSIQSKLSPKSYTTLLYIKVVVYGEKKSILLNLKEGLQVHMAFYYNTFLHAQQSMHDILDKQQYP